MRKLVLYLIILLPFLAKAENYSGSCGVNTTYFLNTTTGLLVLEGSGYVNSNPWKSYASSVKTIQISSGISGFSSYEGDLFNNCLSCTNLIIDDSEEALDLSNAYHMSQYDYLYSYYYLFPSSLTSLYLGRNIQYNSADGGYRRSAMHGTRAFQRKQNLSSISVGPNVTDIDLDEFSGTEWITNVYKSSAVVYLGHIAMYCPSKSTLTSCSLKTGTTVIAGGFYQWGYLQTLTIPSSVKYIMDGAIRETNDIYVNLGSNPYYTKEDGVIYNKDKTRIIFGTSQMPDDYVIPNTVKEIANYAFYCSNINTLTLPPSITDIGVFAFEGTINTLYYNCVNLDPSSSVWTTDNGEDGWGSISTFNGVKTLNIGNNIKSLQGFGALGLTNSRTTTINIGSNVEEIPDYAFENSSITSIVIPRNVRKIGDHIFRGCTTLKKIYLHTPALPETNTSSYYYKPEPFEFDTYYDDDDYNWNNPIEPYAPSATLYVVNSSMKTQCQSNSAWSGFGAYEVQNVATIASGICGSSLSWSLTNFGELTISGTGTMNNYSVASPAPWSSYQIYDIIIDSGVSSIGSYAFAECKNLITFTDKRTVPQLVSSAVFNTLSVQNCTLYVPGASVLTYRGADYWKSFGTITTKDVVVSSISLSKSSLTMNEGETTALTATVSPSNATTKTVTWSSSNSAVATVSNNGLITAKVAGSTTIKATSTDGTNVYGSCVVTVVHPYTLSYKTDSSDSWQTVTLDEDYTIDETQITAIKVEESVSSIELSYSRDFTNTHWQPLYVPFKISVEELEEAGLEVAKLNNAQQIDEDEDGVVDRMQINFIRVKSGSILPNRPYLVRANTTGVHTVEISDATIYRTSVESVDCSTTDMTFTFTGTYEGVSGTTLYNNNYYVMSGGNFCTVENTTVDLKAFRWYMSLTPRDQYGPQYPGTRAVLMVDGCNASTEIEDVVCPVDSSADIVRVKSQMIGLKPGVYSINGQKVIVE